eukprot:s1793_g8.t1
MEAMAPMAQGGTGGGSDPTSYESVLAQNVQLRLDLQSALTELSRKEDIAENFCLAMQPVPPWRFSPGPTLHGVPHGTTNAAPGGVSAPGMVAVAVAAAVVLRVGRQRLRAKNSVGGPRCGYVAEQYNQMDDP